MDLGGKILSAIKIPEWLADPVGKIITSIFILIIGLIIIKIVLVITRKILEKSSLDAVLYRFIRNAIKAILFIVILIMIVAELDGNLGGLLTILAAAGAAIALALRDSLANIAGGVIILINKPFTQDDFIDIDGTTGKVQEIDLFVTYLTTYDNKVITVPNGLINTSILTNYTKENKRRVDCCFRVGYDADIDRAKDILAAVAEQNPAIFKEPKPIIGVAGQEDNHISIDLKVWCKTEDDWRVKYFLEENVKLAFDEAGITIPFPQMDVHIKK